MDSSKDSQSSPPSDRTREQYRLPDVTYSSRRRPRYHGWFESYDDTRPNQSDAALLETYYSVDVPGLPKKDQVYWMDQPHRSTVLEAQFIRQGWLDEITQSDSTPVADVSEIGRTPLERSHGVLAGLAVGDALGRPVEFWSEDDITAMYGVLDSMEGGGTHDQPSGTVSDDTEQALCIATSLASNGEWDPEDVADQFADWYNSDPFDIGTTTRASMEKLAIGVPWDTAGERTHAERPHSEATNGSVMRCAPLALAYPTDTDALVQYSRESSRITHAHPQCEFGAAILNLTIANIITYTDDPLQTALDTVADDAPPRLLKRLRVLPSTRPAPLATTGGLIDTLEVALYYGLTASSFRDAVVSAVNTGGDTDTAGAVTGALAGARFGLYPTVADEPDTAISPEFAAQPSVVGLRSLATRLHELENGLGTFEKDETWRAFVSGRHQS